MLLGLYAKNLILQNYFLKGSEWGGEKGEREEEQLVIISFTWGRIFWHVFSSLIFKVMYTTEL